MEKIIKNKKIIIIASIILIAIISILGIIYFYPKDNIVDKPNLTESNIEVEETKKNLIKIEIKGAVTNPGVYELEENNRVIDAINIAAGLQENADTSIINLSKKLVDEMVIIIYTKDQINEYINNNKKIEYVYLEKECVCPDTINDSCITSDNIYATENTNTSKNSTSTNNSKININTASVTELTTLSGIGESKANKIIEYRNTNGNFKNIEDLKNISGIGDSIYEKIKDQITL